VIPHLDRSDTIVVPIGKTKDLTRIGPTANHFADVLDRKIEVVSIIHPDDDFGHEFSRLATATEKYSRSIGKPVALHVFADALKWQALVDFCDDRLVCMTTSASPYDADHYVGSHAAVILAKSRAPVILVGPAAPDEIGSLDRVVVAIAEGHDDKEALVTGQLISKAMNSPIAKLTIAEKGVIYETDYHDCSSGVPEEVHATPTPEPVDRHDVCAVLVDRSRDAVLVMTTRANQGMAWICEGSVAFDAIADATGPVVAIGPNADLFRTDEAQTDPREPRTTISLHATDAEGATTELQSRDTATIDTAVVTFRATPAPV